MKRKNAKEFKNRYAEQYIDYDIINNCEGYRCVEVFTKDGSKYNLIDKRGYTISDEIYDKLARKPTTLVVGVCQIEQTTKQ